MQRRVGPVAWHLTAAGERPCTGADRFEERVERARAEHQGQRLIAVVGKEPVVSGLQRLAGRHEDGLVSRTTQLKECFLLLLQLHLPLVDSARQIHDAVHPREVRGGQARVGKKRGADTESIRRPRSEANMEKAG